MNSVSSEMYIWWIRSSNRPSRCCSFKGNGSSGFRTIGKLAISTCCAWAPNDHFSTKWIELGLQTSNLIVGFIVPLRKKIPPCSTIALFPGGLEALLQTKSPLTQKTQSIGKECRISAPLRQTEPLLHIRSQTQDNFIWNWRQLRPNRFKLDPSRPRRTKNILDGNALDRITSDLHQRFERLTSQRTDGSRRKTLIASQNCRLFRFQTKSWLEFDQYFNDRESSDECDLHVVIQARCSTACDQGNGRSLTDRRSENLGRTNPEVLQCFQQEAVNFPCPFRHRTYAASLRCRAAWQLHYFHVALRSSQQVQITGGRIRQAHNAPGDSAPIPRDNRNGCATDTASEQATLRHLRLWKGFDLQLGKGGCATFSQSRRQEVKHERGRGLERHTEFLADSCLVEVNSRDNGGPSHDLCSLPESSLFDRKTTQATMNPTSIAAAADQMTNKSRSTDIWATHA